MKGRREIIIAARIMVRIRLIRSRKNSGIRAAANAKKRITRITDIILS
jgi:hypothetical protein